MNLQKITPFMLKNQPDQTSYLLNQMIDKVNTGDIAKVSSGGSATLYPTTGQNTDGAMTQKATTDALNAKANSSDVNVALQNKVDKVAGKGLSENDFTDALKTKLENLDPSGEENVIEKIQKNGTDLPISNKTVNVTVPTKTSDLTNNSNFVSDANYVHTDNNYTSSDKSDVAEIDGIVSKIPAQASSSNQLADKAFVNSSVQTATANFRGNWASWAAVPTNASLYPVDYAGSHTPTVNDYLVVQDASGYTEETLEGTWRFKYSGTWETDGKNGWNPEYQVNETPMTAAQLAALNSGITSAAVTKLSGIQAGAEVNVQTDWDQTDTSADNYLKNKPTLGSLASKNEVQTGDIANRAITGEKIEVLPNLEVNDDSPTGWITALGGYTRAVYHIYYNQVNKFSTQPARYGFLKTIIWSNNIYQEWRTHSSGEYYYRMGNTAGWNGDGWKEIVVDTDNIADSAVTSSKLGLNKDTDKIIISSHRCIYEHQVNIGGDYIGWVKIAKIQLNNSDHFGGQNIVLRMARNYNEPAPESYTFNIDAAWDTKVTIQQISGRAYSAVSQSIQQIRLVKDSVNHILYLELYLNPSRTTYANVLYITMDVVGIPTSSSYGANRWVLLNEVQTEAESSLTTIGNNLIISHNSILDKSDITLTHGSFYGSDGGGLRKIGSGIVVGSFTIQGITKAANAILSLCTLPSGWYNTSANIVCGTCLGPNGEALTVYTRSYSGELMIDTMNTALNNAVVRINLSYYIQ